MKHIWQSGASVRLIECSRPVHFVCFISNIVTFEVLLPIQYVFFLLQVDNSSTWILLRLLSDTQRNFNYLHNKGFETAEIVEFLKSRCQQMTTTRVYQKKKTCFNCGHKLVSDYCLKGQLKFKRCFVESLLTDNVFGIDNDA